ncbi:glycosyltransferase [Geobacter sp. FeAm09]|uniref:glycosyltransferase family 2 protein n=1 Tax=Geobacter sp. FeAm09 TaxID=2597769 RepID=UPI0011EFA1F0|nr:glycosyltransferase [Geobacter sp. FeAm09]QEM68661.1 glycosyltransferase [Geobacter sp. FeAm09]
MKSTAPEGNDKTVKVPKVTVIIAVYNQERYVAQTIESALAQRYDDYAIIAVDDGSTDRSAEIIDAYAGRIRILRHEDHGNHGQAAALNLGLLHAESEYIAFLDNDDLWHPDKLRKQVEILERNQDVGLVYTNGQVIGPDNTTLYPLFAEDHRETNRLANVLLDCYIRTPSLVMVRRSLLQAVGPFTVGIVPDQDMWVRIKERSDFFYLNEKLTYYRQHPEQLSITKCSKMWEDSLVVLKSAMERYPYPAWVRRKRLAVIHYRLGAFCLQAKIYHKAIWHFVRSCWYDPVRAAKCILLSRKG